MNDNSYLIFLFLFLISLFIRTSYELLKRAGKVDPERKSLFALVFAVMCLLWVSWFSMCPVDPWRRTIPDGIKWLGLGAVILGSGLAVGALVQLRGVENIKHLVTTGLFARFRHPMYTGFILWIVGWAIYHGAVISLLFGCVGIGNILFWCWLEDEKLEAAYGDSYRGYRLHTWF